MTASQTLASRLTAGLKNSREISGDCQFFPGMPQRPLTGDELHAKFNALTGALAPAPAAQLFDQCMRLDTITDIGAIEFA